MEQYIHLVVPRRVEVKEVTVQAVREPSQRMPLAHGRREGPLDRVPIKAVLEVGVAGYVSGIVIAGERLVAYRVIEHCGGEHEQKSEEKVTFPGRLWRAPVGQGVVRSFGLRLNRTHSCSRVRGLYQSRLGSIASCEEEKAHLCRCA